MSQYYINATRKPNKTNYSVSELEGYQVCPSKSENGKITILINEAKYYSKTEFFAEKKFNFSENVFKTWNDKLKVSAPITVEESTNGELYLKSKPNNTTTDNLQELPDC